VAPVSQCRLILAERRAGREESSLVSKHRLGRGRRQTDWGHYQYVGRCQLKLLHCQISQTTDSTTLSGLLYHYVESTHHWLRSGYI